MNAILWDREAHKPSDLAFKVYMEGDCWKLAYALHELTGWELYTMSPANDPYDWTHVMVKTPTGQFMDVTGIHDGAAFTRVWIGSVPTPLTAQPYYASYFNEDLTPHLEHFQDLLAAHETFNLDYCAALSLAETLLAQANLS